MKKVLFVINTMGRAGAEMALLELLRRLKGEDLEISLFVLTGLGELRKELPEDVRLLNHSYTDCSVYTAEGKWQLVKAAIKSMFRRGTVFRLLPHITGQLWNMICSKKILPDKLLWRVMSDGAERFTEQYDLAVAYIEGGSTYYVADYVKATKKVAFFHTNYEMAGYTKELDKECYTKFDKIFTVADGVKTSFLKVYPECMEITEVFHNIINRERVLLMAGQPGGFEDEYEGYRILTVGRLTEPKDFAQSVQAMKLLKERGVKARWYILGEGDKRSELEKLIRDLELEEEFFLPGVVDNPYNFMKQADIYVHATRYEGKSVAIQEAQILGCPILVSNCSGNREQVKNGVDGLLCELTPEAICEGIVELLSDEGKRKTFGKMASERMTSECDEIKKLLELL